MFMFVYLIVVQVYYLFVIYRFLTGPNVLHLLKGSFGNSSIIFDDSSNLVQKVIQPSLYHNASRCASEKLFSQNLN